MVSAPDVDKMPETARQLVPMIGDVRCEVRRHTVVAYDNAILVVTVIRRAQPKSAVLFVDLAFFFEGLTGVAHCFRMKRALAEPFVECHMKIGKILLQVLQLFLQCDFLEGCAAFLVAQRKIFLAVRLYDALRRINDVRSMIAVFRKG